MPVRIRGTLRAKIYRAFVCAPDHRGSGDRIIVRVQHRGCRRVRRRTVRHAAVLIDDQRTDHRCIRIGNKGGGVCLRRTTDTYRHCYVHRFGFRIRQRHHRLARSIRRGCWPRQGGCSIHRPVHYNIRLRGICGIYDNNRGGTDGTPVGFYLLRDIKTADLQSGQINREMTGLRLAATVRQYRSDVGTFSHSICKLHTDFAVCPGIARAGTEFHRSFIRLPCHSNPRYRMPLRVQYCHRRRIGCLTICRAAVLVHRQATDKRRRHIRCKRCIYTTGHIIRRRGHDSRAHRKIRQRGRRQPFGIRYYRGIFQHRTVPGTECHCDPRYRIAPRIGHAGLYHVSRFPICRGIVFRYF